MWDGFSILCPDVSKLNGIQLYNYMGSMESKSLLFQVTECLNSTENNNHCKPPDEIKTYLKDAIIEGWMA